MDCRTDGGRTFPFRGQGTVLMPSLDQVLAAFPDRRFLIHIKSNDAGEGRKLAELPKTGFAAQMQRQ